MKLKPQYITLKKEDRLYQVDCPIIGLTGGIASGKSSVSKLFQDKNLTVICADKLVKVIYQEEDTIKFISKNFPQVVIDKKIDFSKLREEAFKNVDNRELIEKYIYARLPEVFKNYYIQVNSPKLLIYDVPLLFEKGLDKLVDHKLCVYTDIETQTQRVMERDGSRKEVVQKIISSQMNLKEKADKSDSVINNSKDIKALCTEVDQWIAKYLT